MPPETEGPTILLLSGPNLDILGQREPEIYGTTTLPELVAIAVEAARTHGMTLDHLQSAREADLVEAVHRARHRSRAVIINPGAFTHYAWALHDALAAYPGIVVELHLSNPDSREAWRRTSVVAPVATATLAGLGALGYRLAVEAVAGLLDREGG